VTPGVSVGTTNTEMFVAPSVRSPVRAKTMSTSAQFALVMKRFCPSMTYASPSRTARVRSPLGSEPASGSVSANDATSSPLANPGRYCCFCRSVPQLTSTWPAIPLLVPNIDRNDGVVQPSSIASRTSSDMVKPRPPYSSGMA
jgi:hypothetical protein